MDLDIDGVEMKNKSMFIKSMLLVTIFILLISIIIAIVTQQGIKRYFERKSFEVLNNELEIFQSYDSESIEEFSEKLGGLPLIANPPSFMKPNKSVRVTIIAEKSNGIFYVPGDTDIFIKLEHENIISNDVWPFYGQTSIQSETVFYAIEPIDDKMVIEKIKENEYKNPYYLAYISESYSKDLTYEVMIVFVTGLVVLIALITIVLFTTFKKISKRLKLLEEGIQKIGKGQFDSNIVVESNDEISRDNTR